MLSVHDVGGVYPICHWLLPHHNGKHHHSPPQLSHQVSTGLVYRVHFYSFDFDEAYVVFMHVAHCSNTNT